MKPKKCDCLKYKSLDSKVKFLKYIPCYCIFCKKERKEKKETIKYCENKDKENQ